MRVKELFKRAISLSLALTLVLNPVSVNASGLQESAGNGGNGVGSTSIKSKY